MPQFYGRIDENIAEWETDVRLWQVEFKPEDRDRLGPRLYWRGLHGQPKTIVKTKLGTQDVSQITTDNIIQCLKDNVYGELPDELGQEALDNYFDMRQGKAERILEEIHIFRKEILTVALNKDTAIDLDEKIRGYWLIRTSNLTEREISGTKIITQGQTQLAQVKKAITQTIVAKKREEVRDDLREAGDRARDCPGGYAEAPNFHLHGDSDDDQDDMNSESESKLFRAVVRVGWPRTRSTDHSERCTKETSTCDEIEKILPKRWRPCKEEGDAVPSVAGKKTAHSLPEAARRDPPLQRAKEKVVGSGEKNLMAGDEEVHRTTQLWRSTMMVRKLKRHK